MRTSTERLRLIVERTRPHRIGVIGESGVGKSTLLNALISERLPLLPQGGVGPMTAVPIEIRHARNPYLRVGCHGHSRIAQMFEACERALASGPSGTTCADAVLVRLATLLTFGSQFGITPLSEVCAFLRECDRREAALGCGGALAERIRHVRRLVDSGESGRLIEIEAGVDLPGLMAALTEYGSGALAPITASIVLGWDAPLLADELTLVDLPGLGIANDLHPLTTLAAIGSIQTFLLVVDRSGLTEAGARVLGQAFAMPEDGTVSAANPGRNLIVAVTKLDQVLAERPATTSHKRGWDTGYSLLGDRMRDVVRAQLESELLRRDALGRSPLRHAVDRAQVACVFPLEYQRLHRRDPDEPARMYCGSATGIPALMAHLRAAARPLQAHTS